MASKPKQSAPKPGPVALDDAPAIPAPTHLCVNGHSCAGVDESGRGLAVAGHGCAIDDTTNTYRHPDLPAPLPLGWG